VPLLDLQRRLAEIGRIRIGASEATSGGRSRPKKLESFRITSRDKSRLDPIAAKYGGTVQQWESQWEVYTETNELPVMLIPGQTLSAWYEMWSGGGCVRRCDGQHEVLSDGPCLCPAADERRDLAANGKACKPTTRLSVLLPDVPGIGCWRLETHGYYAAVELAGAAELLERATAQGVLLPARLRLDQREVKRGGQTRRFAVPMLEVDVAPAEMIELERSQHSVRVIEPARAALPQGTIGEDEQRRIFDAAKDAEIPAGVVRGILAEVAGVERSADVPASKLDEVLAAIAKAGEAA
jgi:hypothetical protein